MIGSSSTRSGGSMIPATIRTTEAFPISPSRPYLATRTRLMHASVHKESALFSLHQDDNDEHTIDASSGLIRKEQARLDSDLNHNKDVAQHRSRRQFMRHWTAGVVATGASGLLYGSGVAEAVMQDETNTFANTDADSSYSSPSNTSNGATDAATTRSEPNTNTNDTSLKNVPFSPTDEMTFVLDRADMAKQGGLGLELTDVEFRTNRRVFVKSVRPGSVAAQAGIPKGFVIVSVNGISAERTNARGAAQLILVGDDTQTNTNKVTLLLRDPGAFSEGLQNLANVDQATVSTQVAPAGDTTQRNADGSVKSGRQVTSQEGQTFSVTQIKAPRLCNHGATTDDLLEISYVGSLPDLGGRIFDGSAVSIDGQGIPGRGNDVSLFFVQGKQPFGQFPPGWDVGINGMCVGERRRILIPPVLGYGATGMPRRGIPPNATLQYDVTLISINGLAIPQ
eukprot:CAMPEP_0198286306 /NCGR_PEP_ID=MMETSP1449-20131203/5425_1 /TAXON_ID=420275 /ORGANISM="Attheya septentrionalis, Strain CCMP2084" /LENGTH=451 /DNA_ID=CAMNT_0043984009 /DNA_START=122 /DNA_END=1477 /DNA_ORIENTATION=+